MKASGQKSTTKKYYFLPEAKEEIVTSVVVHPALAWRYDKCSITPYAKMT